MACSCRLVPTIPVYVWVRRTARSIKWMHSSPARTPPRAGRPMQLHASFPSLGTVACTANAVSLPWHGALASAFDLQKIAAAVAQEHVTPLTPVADLAAVVFQRDRRDADARHIGGDLFRRLRAAQNDPRRGLEELFWRLRYAP